MELIKAEFEFEKETRRTYRFAEVNGETIGTLYVKKTAFDKQPKRVKVTVEVIE